MLNHLNIVTILFLFLTSCGQSDDLNISDYVDHWEISRTFNIYNNSSLDIDTVENEYQVVSGLNQVLIVTIEKNPIYKKGKELTDLYSIQSLLIELDATDNSVSAGTPQNSRFFHQVIAFSPNHGIKPLEEDEKIKITRKDSSIWSVESEIDDFNFHGQLNFKTNQTLTDTYHDY